MDKITHWALANPDAARLRLRKAKAESSLLEFVRLMWPVIEPGRKFVEGWALQVIAEHLEAVHEGKIKRLLVNVPPGFMKSLLFNVFFPAWRWGPKNRPDLRFFGSSYSENLTLRDNGKCLRLIESDIYQSLWGDRVHLDPRKQGERKFALMETGWKLASSVTGTGTGERGDCVILDDLLSAQEVASDAALDGCLQYLTEVIPTRVNDDQSSILIVMQRLHERDPAGHILSNDLNYDRLILPMEYEPDHPHPSRTALGFKDPRTTQGDLLWPERFSREYLEQDLKPTLRSWGGDFATSGQLQQRPAPRGGGLFKRDWFKVVSPNALPPGRDVRGWDLAGSKDGRAPYTVGLRLRQVQSGSSTTYWITDIRRGRWTPAEVRTHIRQTAEEDGRQCVQDLPQDPGQAGLAQKSELATLLDGLQFSITPETGAKEDRARPIAAQAEAGNVYIVNGPWTADFLNEVGTFPTGAFKDQVDALSRAHSRHLRSQTSNPGGAPQTVDLNPIDE